MNRQLPGPTVSQGQLWDELDVNLLWVHVLRGAPLDKMGVNGIAVYVMLKTYTSLDDGKALAKVPEIASRLNISVPTVERALRHLVELGLVERGRPTSRDADKRMTEYTFKEKVWLRDRRSQDAVGELQFGDYRPRETGAQLEEARARVKAGQPLPATVIVNMYNVNVQVGDNNVQNNVVIAPAPGQGTVSQEAIAQIRGILKLRNIDLPITQSEEDL
jgi:DNA-binding Lrp family transcriptional regulator